MYVRVGGSLQRGLAECLRSSSAARGSGTPPHAGHHADADFFVSRLRRLEQADIIELEVS